MLLLRLAYRLIAQLTFLGKVQTVDPNVSEPPFKDVSVRYPFCPNFRPLSTSTLHRSLDFFFFLTTCQNAIVWFSNSFNALGANAQVKEFRVKNLGGQIRQR